MFFFKKKFVVLFALYFLTKTCLLESDAVFDILVAIFQNLTPTKYRTSILEDSFEMSEMLRSSKYSS